MSSAGNSTKVIFIAFAANLGIAVAKFIGAAVSGSASLLAEAIHSLVDCSNQILLLIGNKKAKKAPDEVHPLGYGRESFFWSFMVAILLFSMGGLFAIYEGFHKLHSHEQISSPIIGISILVLAVILESYSFFACYKEIQVNNSHGSLWNWFHNTKNAELLVIFTEDAAAITGLIIATICLSLAMITGESFWDSLGSILVGCILVIVAALLAIEVKSFIIGEAPSHEIKKFIVEETLRLFPDGCVLNFIAIQTGSNEVMLSCKIHPGTIRDVDQAIDLVNELERQSKARFPSIKWQFVELDKKD